MRFFSEAISLNIVDEVARKSSVPKNGENCVEISCVYAYEPTASWLVFQAMNE